MEGIVGLDTIAELSLALAGFSALLAAFRGGAIHTWHPRARLGFWLIITYSFGALFFALLPSLLIDLGTTSWAVPLSALSLFLIVSMTLAIRRNVQLVAAGVPSPSQAVWVLAAVIVVGTAVTLSPRSRHPFGGSTLRMGVQNGKKESKEVYGRIQGRDRQIDPRERANCGFRRQGTRFDGNRCPRLGEEVGGIGVSRSASPG